MERIKEPLCMCCDHPLELIEEIRDDDGFEFEIHRYKCPNCGLVEESHLPDEEDKQSYPAYNGEDNGIADCSHGYNGLCPECGHHIVWGADFMRSEVWGDIPMTKENEEKYDKLLVEKKNLEAEMAKMPDGVEKDKKYVNLNEIHQKLVNLEYDGIDENEDSLAPSVNCPHCGASIQLVYPMTSEQKNYEYYK